MKRVKVSALRKRGLRPDLCREAEPQVWSVLNDLRPLIFCILTFCIWYVAHRFQNPQGQINVTRTGRADLSLKCRMQRCDPSLPSVLTPSWIAAEPQPNFKI